MHIPLGASSFVGSLATVFLNLASVADAFSSGFRLFMIKSRDDRDKSQGTGDSMNHRGAQVREVKMILVCQISVMHCDYLKQSDVGNTALSQQANKQLIPWAVGQPHALSVSSKYCSNLFQNRVRRNKTVVTPNYHKIWAILA